MEMKHDELEWHRFCIGTFCYDVWFYQSHGNIHVLFVKFPLSVREWFCFLCNTQTFGASSAIWCPTWRCSLWSWFIVNFFFSLFFILYFWLFASLLRVLGIWLAWCAVIPCWLALLLVFSTDHSTCFKSHSISTLAICRLRQWKCF